MVRFLVSLLLLAFVLYPLRGAEALDPYKVLGVDKNANQREIQKAFHKLSLQYHPDKNKNKSAQEKFAEINNAYEILSDEEKRKNYDLYGDEKGAPGFDGGNFGGGNFGNREGYTYFTSSGPGDSRFTFRPDGWQQMGGQGSSKSFSFSFGGDPGIGSGSFDFGFGDIFSNFFGGQPKSGSQFGNFGGSYGASSRSSAGTLRDINMQTFKKEIAEQGLTWLLLFYTPTVTGYQVFDSVVGDTANLLRGAIKAGRINCQKDQAICKDLGVWPSKSAKIFLYSYASAERGSLVEYNGEYDTTSLKSFCQNHLPRFSKRVSLKRFQFPSSTEGNLPQVLLLSNKKDTPAIWRVLSGLYRKRVVFFDAEVGNYATDEELSRFKVDALPGVVGRLSNGEEYTLKAGISVKDLSTGIGEMKTLLENFEKRNKKAAASQGKRSSETETGKAALPHLSASNVDGVCADKTPLCLVGVFSSLKAKEKIEQILSLVSQKTLTRRQYNAESDSISYSLLDAKNQALFLNAFDKSWHRRSDELPLLLLAYKPRKGKFAVYTDEMTLEEVERFIGSVLNGDVHFSKVRHRPILQ